MKKSTSENIPVRVAHLVSHPIQYFAPLYRRLALDPTISLTVYFYSGESLKAYFDTEFGRDIEWDVPLLAGYRSILSPAAKRRKISIGFDWKPSWAILKDLWTQEYDVIWVHGYASANAWLTVVLARWRGIQVLLREEQTLLTARSPWKQLAKQFVLPWIYRKVNGLYIGENSRQFFEQYGTKPSNLFPARYCVDNAFFSDLRRLLRPDRAAIRQRWGIVSDAPVVLFCGKLIDKKQPALLLEAFRLARLQQPCHLLIAGDGPLKASLEKKVSDEQIPDVHWCGFLNQRELPSAYVAADIFVLPSAYQETWGLVVNEAMNFSLPVIVSDHVGCASDLVREGENGHIFESGSVESLQKALLSLLSRRETRERYGQRSLAIVADYTIEACSEQVANACRAVSGRTFSADVATGAHGVKTVDSSQPVTIR